MNSKSATEDLQIGFVGTGRMATALAKGFSSGCVAGGQICGVDPAAASREAFAAAIDAATVSADPDTVAAANVVFLAVKPQMMEVVLQDLQTVLSGGKLIVSVAAGLRRADV